MATAPTFVTLDPAADLAEVVAYYESLVGVALTPASVERLILNAIAYRVSLIKAQIQDAATQNLVDFARQPALDYLGIYFGVTRLAAAAALAEVEFTLVSGHGGVTIPGGTRVATTDGKAIFTTIEDIVVAPADTTATGTAECTATGTVGNGYTVGTVTNLLDPQPYLVSVTNTATTTGGSDTETDDALRVRIKAAPAAFSVAGSRKAYRYFALTASALLSDVAVPDVVTPGTVNIYPLMADGSVTPSGILQAVEDACSAETVRPLSDTVVVTAPTRVDYDIEIEVQIFTGFDATDAEDAITAAIQEWATAKRQLLGQDITDVQIFAVVSNAVPGQVYDAQLVGWSDIVIDPTEFGFLDNLTVTVTVTANT